MQENKIHILCTRPVSEAMIEQASDAGIEIHGDAFIETEPLQTIEVLQEIEQAGLLSATVVFTSMNAVEAVAEALDGHQPDWQVFCIGHATRVLVEKYFGEHAIKNFADDADTLADAILIEEGIEEVIFFCGDQRRDELPLKLKKNGIDVQEIVVYQTIEIPHKVNRNYHGVLFFSPTAVKSFFKLNQPNQGTIFFAIGNTTASEIKKFTNSRIIIGEEPSKEKLVEMAIGFFAAN